MAPTIEITLATKPIISVAFSAGRLGNAMPPGAPGVGVGTAPTHGCVGVGVQGISVGAGAGVAVGAAVGVDVANSGTRLVTWYLRYGIAL